MQFFSLHIERYFARLFIQSVPPSPFICIPGTLLFYLAMQNVIKAYTPNFAERTANIRFLVLHHTELPDIKSVYDIFADKSREVSSHYLIGKDGSIHQFVDDKDCAWHAGVSYWKGVENLNHSSIGIELDNNGDEPFTPELMKATIALCQHLIKTHNINEVVAHSDIAYWRKIDPSVYLNWAELAKHGIGVVSDVEAEDKIKFTPKQVHRDLLLTKHKLHKLGYKISELDHDEFCDMTLSLFQAFKRRFVKESYHHNNWDALCEARLNDLLRIYENTLRV